VAGKQIVEIGLPRGVLIVLVSRGEEFLVPSGGTVLEAGDKLLVLAEKSELADIRALFKAPLAPDSALNAAE
jgi:Trk K+ transport system NAD-binding subunit